jgi:hypothetical protein
VVPCVRGVAADVDAVGKLAWERLREPVAVDELVLLEDESENGTRKLFDSEKSFWQLATC